MIPPNLRIKTFVANTHIDLESRVNRWLRRRRFSKIVDWQTLVDGAEYIYTAIFLYRPISIKGFRKHKKMSLKPQIPEIPNGK